MQCVDIRNRHVVECDDDVPDVNAGLGRGGSSLHGFHAHAGFAQQAEMTHQAPRQGQRLTADPEPSATHATVAYERHGHPLGGGGGNGKTNALRGHDHRGIDADHLAARVDQRPARIAGIERCIGLQNVVQQAAGAGSHRAAERTDDPRRDGVGKTVRTADRNGDLPDPDVGRIGQATPGEIRRAHLQDGEVGIGIVADDLRGGAAAIRQGHLDGGGAARDMAVRDEIAVGRD